MVTVTTKQHIIDKGNNVSNVQDFDSSEDFYSMEGDYSNSCGCSGIDGDYSNLDANSPKNEIQRFQAWMNATKSIPLSGGTWDADTMTTYKIYGKEYESTENKDYDKTNAEFDRGVNNPVTGVKGGGTFKETVIVTKKNPIGDASKDKKKKGMSDTAKILIGLGIALVLGTTIYFIAKK